MSPITMTVIYSLRQADKMYIGNLGIRPKSYDHETGTVNFNASFIVSKDGKSYQQKCYIEVQYNRDLDLFTVRAIRYNRNFERLIENKATHVDSDQLYAVIYKMTNQ